MKKLKFIIIFYIVFAFIFLNSKAFSQTTIPTIPTIQTNFSSQTPEPTKPPPSYNVFNYTPVPPVSPKYDIVESSPLTVSRTLIAVDDLVTFSVGITNQSAHDKTLYNFCFESSDGNFGCIWGIHLAPGQTYSAQNVGSWYSGGTKNIWVDWSQDGRNFYKPVNSRTVSVTVINY